MQRSRSIVGKWMLPLIPALLGSLLAVAPHAYGQGSKVVKIAYVGPLTGPNTAVGIGTRNSIELAIRQANERKDLPFKVELISETDDSKPSTGVDAVKKICDDPNIVAASAHWNSPVALATSRYFKDCGLLNLISGAASDKLTQEGIKEVGRVNTSVRYQFPLFGKRMHTEMGIRTVAIVRSRDDYGNDLSRAFASGFEKSGGKIVAEESYNIGDRDFTAMLTKIRPLRPDGIFLAGLSTEAALVARQMRQLGIKSTYLGHAGWSTKTFTDSAGAAGEGSIVVTALPLPEELGERGLAYLAAYSAAGFRDPPDIYGPFGYAAGQIFVELLKRVGPDRKKIVNALRGLKDVETIFGRVHFDEDGEMQPKQIGLAALKDGKWIPFNPSKK